MDKIKKAILFLLPMSVCNLRCHYCYLAQRDECYQNIQPKFHYSPEHVAKALSPNRLGGLAYMNFCADGETLLTKNLDDYIYELVKMGHYAEIVTNLTITASLEKILSWEKDLLKRIAFKCSFHYLELKRKNLLSVFSENVNKIWKAGASANIEITPSDELIPYIEEVKKFSIDNFGALPHITIARNDRTTDIDYLTNLTLSEYDRIWSQFNSDFWKFKKQIFKEKREEFCYAGDWLLVIDLFTGLTSQCYHGRFSFDIFKSLNKKIPYQAIGKCLEPHCYNGHALLTLGCIPNFTDIKYGNIRNRVRDDCKEWLQPELLSFFNTKLCESNNEYSEAKKRLTRVNNKIRFLCSLPGKVFHKITSRNKKENR